MSFPATTSAAEGAGLSWRLVRSDGRPREVVAFEESVVTFFLEAAELLGVPKSLAAIYGICFASAEPLCYSDVRGRLDISAGSISQGLRVLREFGALKVVTAGIDRREFFAPDVELRKLVSHFIEHRLQHQLNTGRDRLRRMKKLVPADDGRRAKELNRRLEYLRAWHAKTAKLVPVAKAYLKLS